MAQPRAKSSRRLDWTLFAGPSLALAGILGGLFLEGGRMRDLHQLSAALIVFGGTAGAVVLTAPMTLIKRAFNRLKVLVWVSEYYPEELIGRITDYARLVRWHGMVALESTALAIEDPFWRKALMLAVDGAEEDTIRQTMDLEMNIRGMEADNEAGVFESAAGYAPTIGIIGAVLGLIQVMRHIDEISMVGAGIATAFVATIYGVALANLVLLPLAQRLRLHSQRAMLMNELVVEGVIGIRQGLNPVLLGAKLSAFVPQGKSAAPRPVRMEPQPQPRAVSA
jgi:chemotaxis protein MotA